MNDPSPCQPNGGVCQAHRAVTLREALEQWQREAVHGVCDTGRYQCPYFAWGSGPPLVFIHGLAETQRSFVWISALLKDHFRCIAYDLPTGRGDGACLGRYKARDLPNDLFALLDHLGLHQAYLFGSSFGSTIALRSLHARPQRVPRAILQGGFARRPLNSAAVFLARCARYWPGTMRLLPWRRAHHYRLHHAAFEARPPEVWDLLMDVSNAVPMRAVARRAVMLHRLDLRPTLPEIRQPVLLVCGDDDPLVGRSCEDELLKGLPNARRVEFAGCGHFPYLTHTEALAEVLRLFLTPPDERTGARCVVEACREKAS